MGLCTGHQVKKVFLGRKNDNQWILDKQLLTKFNNVDVIGDLVNIHVKTKAWLEWIWKITGGEEIYMGSENSSVSFAVTWRQ